MNVLAISDRGGSSDVGRFVEGMFEGKKRKGGLSRSQGVGSLTMSRHFCEKTKEDEENRTVEVSSGLIDIKSNREFQIPTDSATIQIPMFLPVFPVPSTFIIDCYVQLVRVDSS